MDLKKFIENQGLADLPVGLGGCRNLDYFFDSCDYDLMVFDENSSNNQIISFENDIITTVSYTHLTLPTIYSV